MLFNLSLDMGFPLNDRISLLSKMALNIPFLSLSFNNLIPPLKQKSPECASTQIIMTGFQVQVYIEVGIL
jgi:hypothetical protein